MPLSVDDLCSELDCLALDLGAATIFGETSFDSSLALAEKRRYTVEHWLEAKVRAAGYNPRRHRTHYAPDKVWGSTSGVWTDLTATLADATPDDVDLSTVLAAPTDALYVSLLEVPRGAYLHMLEAVNVNSQTALSVEYWTGGQWRAVSSLVDGTMVATSIALSGGGRLQWTTPPDWRERTVNPDEDTARRFSFRLRTNRAPSASTLVGQVLPVRASRLTGPASYRALAMLYEEAAVVTRGDWEEKAQRFYTLADEALNLIIGDIRDEFDVDNDGAVERDEINSVVPIRSTFLLERG